MSNRTIVVAALFVFAFLWVGLMGLVGVVTGKTTTVGGGGPYTDDGSIKAEITHVDKKVDDKGWHIALTVKITDKDGKVLPGLTATEIETAENGDTVNYQNFTSAGHAPVRICLCIDYSNSMRGPKIEGAKAAALALLASLRDGTDHLGMFIFNGRATGTEALPMGVLDPARRKQAEDAIKNTPLAGGTPMLGTMDRALHSLEGFPGKRVMVIMTDGMDTGGGNAQNVIKPRIIESAKKQGTPLHMIALETGKGAAKGNNERAMRELSDPTGGKYHFAPKPDDLKDIYINIGQALKDEYVIEYDSPNPVEDGQTRNIAVIVRKGPVGTLAKASYPVPGVVATGTAARAAKSTSGSEQPSVPFASVLAPLGLLMGTLFAVPYFMWLRPKSSV